ncbi:MAG: hypothetical protein GX358_04920 [candidate division WS1 bacterium]|nr:hypothetical protein [candidate division WS1 bacterium]
MFWRILISYCIIGFLMAFPSYRLGLRAPLAVCVFVGVTAFGVYHAAIAVRAKKPAPVGESSHH